MICENRLFWMYAHAQRKVSAPSLRLIIILLCWSVVGQAARAQVSGDTEWPTYGNDRGGMRYSPLAQINRENVPKLKIAWYFIPAIFRMEDMTGGEVV